MITVQHDAALQAEDPMKIYRNLFHPGTIAVIGASNDPLKPGGRVIKNIKENGYAGRLWAVNPKAGDILGLPTYASIQALPETPDLAIVAIPSALVLPALEELAVEKRTPRAFVEEYQLADGRNIRLLGEGRLVNLAAAEGHPAAVMDMSFANQAVGAVYMYQNGQNLEKKVYAIPEEIDREIARLKLEAMGIKIDVLTPEQEAYLNSWQEGT